MFIRLVLGQNLGCSLILGPRGEGRISTIGRGSWRSLPGWVRERTPLIAVTGSRRLGKTSLLLILLSELGEPSIFIGT